jgi:hypothetical protein
VEYEYSIATPEAGAATAPTAAVAAAATAATAAAAAACHLETQDMLSPTSSNTTNTVANTHIELRAFAPSSKT